MLWGVGKIMRVKIMRVKIGPPLGLLGVRAYTPSLKQKMLNLQQCRYQNAQKGGSKRPPQGDQPSIKSFFQQDPEIAPGHPGEPLGSSDHLGQEP